MHRARIGLVADPAKPTEIARGLRDVRRPGGHPGQAWDMEVVSAPFTAATEDVGTALSRLTAQAQEHHWDLVIGITELPLRDGDGRYLLVETDPRHHAAVLSLPALGGVRMHQRSRHAVRQLLTTMADSDGEGSCRVLLPRRGGRWRLLRGMVVANRPWLLVPGLRSALVAALTTGVIATINSTVWLLAGSMSWWRLVVAMVVSVALVVGWLVIDGELWDRAENETARARERSKLYNTSTLMTLTAGVLICYAALYILNLTWALFVLDLGVMGGDTHTTVTYGDLFVLAWFVTSAATVGGALGSSLESDEAITAAAYSKREEERRNRLSEERT